MKQEFRWHSVRVGFDVNWRYPLFIVNQPNEHFRPDFVWGQW